MIPPVSPQTWEQNPQFAQLWKHLTTQILDLDGSRKSLNEARRWHRHPSSDDVHSGNGRNDSNLSEDHNDHDEDDEDSHGGDGLTNEQQKTNKAEKKDIEQQLEDLRVKQAKREILTFSLDQVAYPTDKLLRQGLAPEGCHSHDSLTGPALSAEIKDVLLLVSASLDTSRNRYPKPSSTDPATQIDMDDDTLPQEDRDRFLANMDTISDAVSRYLITTERRLAELAALATTSDTTIAMTHPSQQASGSQGSSDLYSLIAAQTRQMTQLRTTRLPTSLATLHETQARLQTEQTRALQTMMTRLEKTKHGVETRHGLARAAFFAAVAQTMDLKVQVMLLEERERHALAGAKTTQWVATRLRELRAEHARLDASIDALKAVCGEYEAVDPGINVMPALGARYRDVELEIQTVKADIERLQSEIKLK